jgi:hypothetical protein
MRLDGPQWRTPQAFNDGEALWEALCQHELEGVVAKRRSSLWGKEIRFRLAAWAVVVQLRRPWGQEILAACRGDPARVGAGAGRDRRWL